MSDVEVPAAEGKRRSNGHAQPEATERREWFAAVGIAIAGVAVVLLLAFSFYLLSSIHTLTAETHTQAVQHTEGLTAIENVVKQVRAETAAVNAERAYVTTLATYVAETNAIEYICLQSRETDCPPLPPRPLPAP